MSCRLPIMLLFRPSSGGVDTRSTIMVIGGQIFIDVCWIIWTCLLSVSIALSEVPSARSAGAGTIVTNHKLAVRKIPDHFSLLARQIRKSEFPYLMGHVFESRSYGECYMASSGDRKSYIICEYIHSSSATLEDARQHVAFLEDVRYRKASYTPDGQGYVLGYIETIRRGLKSGLGSYLVLRRFEGHTLDEAIYHGEYTHRPTTGNDQKLQRTMHSLVLQMLARHSNHVAHGNLKTTNILLVKTGTDPQGKDIFRLDISDLPFDDNSHFPPKLPPSVFSPPGMLTAIPTQRH